MQTFGEIKRQWKDQVEASKVKYVNNSLEIRDPDGKLVARPEPDTSDDGRLLPAIDTKVQLTYFLQNLERKIREDHFIVTFELKFNEKKDAIIVEHQEIPAF
jgi:hypothetical protein